MSVKKEETIKGFRDSVVCGEDVERIRLTIYRKRKPFPAEKREYGKYERNQTLRNCLNYCRHRLKKHQNTGLHKIGCQLEFVEQLEREFFPKQPDIQPKPKDRIEEVEFKKEPLEIAVLRLGDKLNELIRHINKES
jgi:hypothetical protein